MRLVVTTWNLQGSRGVDVGAVASHLANRGSDIVFLQEVQRNQARRIGQALSAQSVSWGFKHWPVRVPAEGMAIVGVSTPVSAVRTFALTSRWRFWNWRRRIVQIGRTDGLTVVNIHLSPHDEPGLRERQVDRIMARLPADATGVLAGDFNDLPNAALFTRLRERGYQDAAADAGATNWSRGRGTKPPNRRLDYVWVSADIESNQESVPSFDDPGFEVFPRLSDHLPLTVGLTRL